MSQPIIAKRQRVGPMETSETKEDDSQWMLPDCEWKEMQPVDALAGPRGKYWRDGKYCAPNGDLYVGYKPSTNEYWTLNLTDAEWKDLIRMSSTSGPGMDESLEILQTKLMSWTGVFFKLEFKFRVKTYDPKLEVTTIQFLTKEFQFLTNGRKLRKQSRPYRNVFEAILDGRATPSEKKLFRRLATKYGSTLHALRDKLLLDDAAYE